MRRTTEDYRDLITPFHIHRQKFTDTVEGLVSPLIVVNDAALDLPAAFDLDFAVGVQLDIVGKWIGKDRFVPYPLETFYFSFDDPIRGFDMAVWAAPYDADFGIFRLGDEDYRRLLYAKIGVNHWDGTFETAEATLLTFYGANIGSDSSLYFPDESGDLITIYWGEDPLVFSSGVMAENPLYFLEDKGDSHAIFGVSGPLPPPVIIAMLSWEAVKFDISGGYIRTMVTSIDSTPLFGFDMNNEYVSGFGSGSWGVEPLAMFNRGDPGVTDFSDPIYSGLIPAVT